MSHSTFSQPPATHRLVTLGGLALLRDGRPVEGSGVRGRTLALLAILTGAARPASLGTS